MNISEIKIYWCELRKHRIPTWFFLCDNLFDGKKLTDSYLLVYENLFNKFGTLKEGTETASVNLPPLIRPLYKESDV